MSYVLLVNVLVSQLNKSVWTSKHIKLQQVKLHIKLLLKLLLLLLLLLLTVVQVFCFQRVVAYEAPQISTLMIFIHAYQRTALHFFVGLYILLFLCRRHHQCEKQLMVIYAHPMLYTFLSCSVFQQCNST